MQGLHVRVCIVLASAVTGLYYTLFALFFFHWKPNVLDSGVLFFASAKRDQIIFNYLSKKNLLTIPMDFLQ